MSHASEKTWPSRNIREGLFYAHQTSDARGVLG
jgi:hypothetical protein